MLAEKLINAHVAEGDMDVRVFRDLSGEVTFATLDDVHIDPESDPRLLLVHSLANDYMWPHNFAFPESIEGYEGSLHELARSVISSLMLQPQEEVTPVEPRGPKKRTLKQKQGARAAGRTRTRGAT